MQKNKPRKYAVILQRPWGQGEYPLGVVLSTSIKAANIVAINKIFEATANTDVKIRRTDFISCRPWKKVGIGTRKLLTASGVRF